MGRATQYIARSREGGTVRSRPRGHSMPGEVNGRLCAVEPVAPSTLAVGDLFLFEVNGRQYLRLVQAIRGDHFPIGNDRGRIDGWLSAGASYGRCIRVE